VSQPIDLNFATSATLTFWTWFQTENVTPALYDLKYVEISTNNGADWTELRKYAAVTNPGHPAWYQDTIDLSPYIGQNIRIQFRFDTVDAQNNSSAQGVEGWYIDDVTISGDYEFPLIESTLLVRVIEAASISFVNGGPTPITDGDRIVGLNKGTTGLAKGDPILASGSWAAGDAAGIILMTNVVGTSPFYISNEELQVRGTVVAEVPGVVKFIQKANYIRAYYGDPAGSGNPNDDPLDDAKQGNPRNPTNVNWPPDQVKDWSAEADYFTLVQWDAVNDGAVATVGLIPSLAEPGAVIESTALITPNSSLATTRAELGLHAFGKGAQNVYFDDFALQTDVISAEGFLPATQSSGGAQ
jgi:hypothetical protein